MAKKRRQGRQVRAKQRRSGAGGHNFSATPPPRIPRSAFNRSSNLKTTLNEGGILYPCYVDEALPGDTMNMSVSSFARLATPIHPVIDGLEFSWQMWAVPIRLVWENFSKFMGEQENPGDSTDFTIPQNFAHASGAERESLSDYMGIPPEVEGWQGSVLWHRAYNLIWNEFYRDQNLMDKVLQHTDDGTDSWNDYELLRRSKKHDYFTQALPWPQKGPAVEMPVGGLAPITGLGFEAGTSVQETDTFVTETGGDDVSYPFSRGAWNEPQQVHMKVTGDGGDPDVWADLASAQAATVNQMREAVAMQQLLERDARGGEIATQKWCEITSGLCHPTADFRGPSI